MNMKPIDMAKRIYIELFILGVLALAVGSYLRFPVVWSKLSEALAVVAAYFWIRKDIWKSDSQITKDEDRSYRKDCRSSFFLLLVIIIFQCFSSGEAGLSLFGITLVGTSVGQWLAPLIDKIFSRVINHFFHDKYNIKN